MNLAYTHSLLNFSFLKNNFLNKKYNIFYLGIGVLKLLYTFAYNYT